MAKKIFILDTNVLLHDHQCIYNFDDNDIIIPIVVLEELDKFKKGNDHINYQAREFVREIDRLAGEKLFSDGVPLGTGKGKIFVATGKPFPEIMNESFSEKNADHRILAITLFVKDKFPKRKVILITKDINMRMKAKSLGIHSQDYESDKVKDLDVLYKGVEIYEDFDQAFIAKLYENTAVAREEFPLEDDPPCGEAQCFRY